MLHHDPIEEQMILDEEFTTCDIHGTLYEIFTDCPGCIQEENDQDMALMYLYLEQDSISGHHPDCQCARCIYGDSEYIRNFHPSEY